MARKIELKTVQVGNGVDGPIAMLSYGEMLNAMLRQAPPQGLVLDEVIRAVDAIKTLEAAVKKGADSVTFPEDQYQTVVERLDTFKFAVAAPEIADFGNMVRRAPELT